MVLERDGQDRTHTLKSSVFRKNQFLDSQKRYVCRGRRADTTLMHLMMWEFRKNQGTCNVITPILRTLGRSLCEGRTPLQPHRLVVCYFESTREHRCSLSVFGTQRWCWRRTLDTTPTCARFSPFERTSEHITVSCRFGNPQILLEEKRQTPRPCHWRVLVRKNAELLNFASRVWNS
jgi:hypothetical protein